MTRKKSTGRISRLRLRGALDPIPQGQRISFTYKNDPTKKKYIREVHRELGPNRFIVQPIDGIYPRRFADCTSTGDLNMKLLPPYLLLMLSFMLASFNTFAVEMFVPIPQETPNLSYSSSGDELVIHTIVESEGGKAQRTIFAFDANNKTVEYLTYTPLSISWDEYMEMSSNERLNIINAKPKSFPFRRSQVVKLILPTGLTEGEVGGFFTRTRNLGQNRYDAIAANNSATNFMKRKDKDAIIIKALRASVLPPKSSTQQ